MKILDIIESYDKWTPHGKYLFRRWDNKLYRKEINKLFFGGYQIKYVYLTNKRGLQVANEWLQA